MAGFMQDEITNEQVIKMMTAAGFTLAHSGNPDATDSVFVRDADAETGIKCQIIVGSIGPDTIDVFEVKKLSSKGYPDFIALGYSSHFWFPVSDPQSYQGMRIMGKERVSLPEAVAWATKRLPA